ncbi:hypothetical protein PBCV1_a359L [Paramecium bursaria Chlorella virus 1]|uniref:Uncharacterized protein n=1 Tax=Paramecium bursaria Chlorella virus 1 TaxID=10506 RepID=Q84673_PBCV1|nr:hypothetical protein PBCV1_a359L [Paramecium bursaria Chlorella virus 1]AAC96727.2 hypothetical protein [Paramecium bursaria Chlorella virus 1]
MKKNPKNLRLNPKNLWILIVMNNFLEKPHQMEQLKRNLTMKIRSNIRTRLLSLVR